MTDHAGESAPFSNPELASLAILAVPVPPWQLAARHSEAGLTEQEAQGVVGFFDPHNRSRVTEEERAIAPLTCEASLVLAGSHEPLFVPVLAQLRADVCGIDEPAAPFMRPAVTDQVGIVADIIEELSNPEDAIRHLRQREALWQDPTNPTTATAWEWLRVTRSGLDASGLPVPMQEQEIARTETLFDPTARAGAYATLLSVIYEERYAEYCNQFSPPRFGTP